MKRLFQVTLGCLILGLHVVEARAAFTSLYVFGDGVCTTTNSPGGPQFYGYRFSNGRVWVEVLAQRQGLPFDPNKNWSFFGHFSSLMLQHVTNSPAPADVASALYVIWANDADFVSFISQFDANSTKLSLWTNAMNQSLSNNFAAIQNLYQKGARALVMPNVVDLMQVPFYVQLPAAEKNFIRARIAEYNLAFAARLNQARAAFPNLVIYAPDIRSLLDDILARPLDYGVNNAQDQGFNIDALSDPNLADKSLNGPGANYIFWEYLDPTARVHAILADTVQSLLLPPRVASVSPVAASNTLQLVNLPVGLSGAVEAATNFTTWTAVASFNCTNAAQSILVPATPPRWFYRLRFPFAWSWP